MDEHIKNVGSVGDTGERAPACTERERLLAEIDGQRRLNQAVADHAPVGIIVIGATDLRVRSANQAYLDLLDEPLRSTGVVGMHIKDVIPGTAERGEVEIYRSVGLTGEPLSGTAHEFDGFERGTTYWNWSLQRLPAETADAEPALLLLTYEVTDLVQARQRAEEHAAHLDALLASVADGLVFYDACGRITRMNPTSQALMGVSAPDQLPALDARTGLAGVVVDGDGRPLPAADWPVAKALGGETVRNAIMGIQVPDRAPGDLLWVSINAAPVGTAPGAPTGAVLSFADVTDLRATREELEQANAGLAQQRAFLEVVVRQMPAGVFIAEAPSGRLLLGNDQAVRILRQPYRPADTVSDYGQFLGFHPDGRPYLPEEWPLARAIATGEVVQDVEINILRGDGSHGVIVASATPIVNAEGQITAGVTTFHDVTQQKELEQALRRAHDELEMRVQERTRELTQRTDELSERTRELSERTRELTARTAELVEANEALHAEIGVRREAEDALRESEMRFRQLAEHIGEMFFLLEPEEYHLLYVSPAYEKLWGRPATELYGSLAGMLRGIHCEDRRQAVAAWRAGWRGYDQEFRVVRPDGSTRWVRARTFPIACESGAVHRVAGIVEDVTAQKEAQAAVIQAERLNTAGLMAGSLSHEINNPLQAAMGCLSLAQEAVQAGDAPERYLEVAHRSMQRTATVVTQLRALFGTPVEERSVPVRLDGLLNQVLGTCQPRCETHRITVVRKFEPGLAPVHLMPNVAKQVFLNLTISAIEAMPCGGVLEVGLERSPSPGGVCVRIADTGDGLSPEALERVFEPFYSSRHETMGLALFISRNLVERLEGRIDVESDGGHGVVFSVWLPA